MKQNACQLQIIENILLNEGYVSRNYLIKNYISRASKYIQDLREYYIIDTIHYKKKRLFRRSWGDCLYVIKESKDGNWVNEKYWKQLEYFIKTNKLHTIRPKFYTNDNEKH
jgi:hypothetical protein